MSIINCGSNVSGGKSGIRWNIKGIEDLNQLPIVGEPGDVYIITDVNVKNIKKVASIYDGDDLVDNAVNIFINQSSPELRINEYFGWKFDARFGNQTILSNGLGLYTPCVFWDMKTKTWVRIEVSYNFRDTFSFNSFVGSTIDYGSIIPEQQFSESISYIQPECIKNTYSDSFEYLLFMYKNDEELIKNNIMPSFDEECNY